MRDFFFIFSAALFIFSLFLVLFLVIYQAVYSAILNAVKALEEMESDE